MDPLLVAVCSYVHRPLGAAADVDDLAFVTSLDVEADTRPP